MTYLQIVTEYLIARFNGYIPSQVIDMMIKYERFIANDSFRSGVYKSCNYREM